MSLERLALGMTSPASLGLLRPAGSGAAMPIGRAVQFLLFLESACDHLCGKRGRMGTIVDVRITEYWASRQDINGV